MKAKEPDWKKLYQDFCKDGTKFYQMVAWDNQMYALMDMKAKCDEAIAQIIKERDAYITRYRQANEGP
jgi:hypothetical protein